MHPSMIHPSKRSNVVRKATREERKILNGSVPEEARVTYPRIIQQTSDPHVNGPKWMLVSYVLLEPEKRVDPDIEGVFMIRDTPLFQTETEAKDYAAKMLREVDSLNRYYPIQIGHPYILSKSMRFVKNKTRVPIERQQVDVQLQENDEKMMMMMNTLDLCKKEIDEEETQEEKAQAERIRNMRITAQRQEDKDTLEHYTMLRSKYDNILKNCRDLTLKTKLLDKFMTAAYKTRDEILAINEIHPEYEDMWLKEYERTLAMSGIRADVIKELADPKEFAEQEGPVRIIQLPKKDAPSQA